MTSNVSPSRSNLMSSSHPSKGSLTDRPSSCSNKSLVHNKSCPVHSRHLSYKTIGQCHDKIEELEKQNARLVSKVCVNLNKIIINSSSLPFCCYLPT